jgi:hypothetical protein
MKKAFLSLAALLLVTSAAKAQTADEIIAKYFENTGGYAKWAELKGISMKAKVNQGGLEIPLEIVQLKEGKSLTKITFQGLVIKQGVFDGKDLWSTNFQTMKAEKSDDEQTANQVQESKDFPDALFEYKKKGYKVELLGKETIEGTETFKVKLTKKPLTIDGKQVDNIVYYYFDAENFVPIVQEQEVKSGPAKGQIGQTKLSDYQEVNGLFFPFTLSQGVKGGGSQPLVVESIALNPVIDAAEFAFPKQ